MRSRKQRHSGCFSSEEREAMLALSGVGPTVIQRLEELGYRKLEDLRDKDPRELATEVSELMGSTCWRDSPQARKAMERIIVLADNNPVSA